MNKPMFYLNSEDCVSLIFKYENTLEEVRSGIAAGENSPFYRLNIDLQKLLFLKNITSVELNVSDNGHMKIFKHYCPSNKITDFIECLELIKKPKNWWWEFIIEYIIDYGSFKTIVSKEEFIQKVLS